MPKLHPLNIDFEWPATAGPFRAITDAQAKQFDEDGFFVLEDAFDADTVARMNAEIDPWEEKTTEFLRKQEGGRLHIAYADAITFTIHLVKRSEFLKELVSTGVLRDVAHDLVGPDVNFYWDQAVYKKPEKPQRFPWHQDNGYNFVEPQRYLTCWIPLTDATPDNGCPVVVPGLHRQGTLEHWWTDYGWQCIEDPEDAVTVPAKAGSIVVFSSLSPHQTGPNLTDEVRKAYIVQYAPVGARLVKVEDGERIETIQDAPDRQFPILRDGEPAG